MLRPARRARGGASPEGSMRHASWLAAAALLGAAPASAGGLTPTDLMRLARLSDPQVSPDGRTVVYTASQVNLGANNSNSDLWVVPLAGGEPRRLTNHPMADSRPRWSPDGKAIGFLSRRGGSQQVYSVEPGGGEPRQLTQVESGVNSFLWISPERLLVVSDVYPECQRKKPPAAAVVCNKQKTERAGKPSTARAYDALLYRHWDTWEDGKRTHLLVVGTDGGDALDLTPVDTDVPPFSLSGPDDFAVSPDGKEVVFARI